MYAPCRRNRVLRKLENGKRQMANLLWICSRKNTSQHSVKRFAFEKFSNDRKNERQKTTIKRCNVSKMDEYLYHLFYSIEIVY